jgi:hypothetical protein
MSTFFITLGILEFIWFVFLIMYGFFEARYRYKKFVHDEIKLRSYVSKVILSIEFISVYLVGAVIIFCVAVPATWFILIFNFIEKLIEKI